MTPAARVSAAIEILDGILSGQAAEKLMTRWGRANRYAGSGDRAAIRDHVFSALRCKRSYGVLGVGETGRGLMIGATVASGTDCNTLFTGDKYAPDPLSEDEARTRDLDGATDAVRLDCPDWLYPVFQGALGTDTNAILGELQQRAPVFLRVNLARTDVATASAALLADSIETEPHPLTASALRVLTNPRRVAQSALYRDGLVELQDAASQAVVDRLPLRAEQSVLDYCAGGGGKTLAMAARVPLKLTAHDLAPQRMRDLPARAARAGVQVRLASGDDLVGQRFDLVLCDVPCSGSGAWRRSPDAKWSLTPDGLQEFVTTQVQVMENAMEFVSEGGLLAYVTCSLFRQENQDQVAAFLDTHDGWHLDSDHQFTPLEGGDGFYVAILGRVPLA